MAITDLGITGVASITVICYSIGIFIKNLPVNDKWIPACVGLAGAFLGLAALRMMPGFPADNIIDALAVGIVSGLASTGVNQIVKQLGG